MELKGAAAPPVGNVTALQDSRPAAPASEGAAVLAWWHSSGIKGERDRLPWRAPGIGPFAVLVSETMLAQTQVNRVAERFPAFMERYSSAGRLAAAPLGDVLRVWQGLGYPRRAANLWRAAATITSAHGGDVPADLHSLLALPGVGAYTARAVLAFAFDEATMPVDTNIGRILARLNGRALRPSQAQVAGDALLAGADAGRGGDAALAFMDLGAALCRPARPCCHACPLRRACSWGDRRLQGGDPADPAHGSAGVSRPQRPFAGSDRQGRGRLLRAAAGGPVTADELASVAGWPGDSERAERVAASLVTDGLLRLEDGNYFLP